MNTRLFRNIALIAAIALTVSACGGGGGDTVAGGGTGGTGVSFGTVTDFGSIIVNGGQLDNSAASVLLDDNPGTGPNGGLKKGMVVRVSGTFSGNTGTATTIVFSDNLEGPVCNQSTVNGITTIRVLGQTVIVDATTIVENGPINQGELVEVSGLPDAQENIHASFIEKKTLQSAVIEVKGRIDTLGPTTFTINNLVVNYTPGVIDNSIPGGQLAVGQFVEVKGTVFACNSPTNGTDTLTATRVELEPEGAGAIPAGIRAEIEGFITLVNAGGFMIGNQQVATTGSTRFLPEDFGTADLMVGAKVEAEGTLAGGVLTATKISFRQNVKLESDVDVTTITGTSPTFSFSLVGLPNIVITTNSQTQPFPAFAPTGQIRVRGIEGPNNTVLATRIDNRSASPDVFLQGPVDIVAEPNISILGVTVNTSSSNFQFEDVNDVVIPRATFFGSVRPGTLVKIKGTLAGTSVTWDEAELED